MEDRRSIHYHRNSVIVPKLGMKSRHAVMKRPLTGVPADKVPQNREPKICSTLECPRCGADQDQYRATCRKCRCCFYCGLTGGSVFRCHLCGNHIPEDDREFPVGQSIKIG